MLESVTVVFDIKWLDCRITFSVFVHHIASNSCLMKIVSVWKTCDCFRSQMVCVVSGPCTDIFMSSQEKRDCSVKLHLFHYLLIYVQCYWFQLRSHLFLQPYNHRSTHPIKKKKKNKQYFFFFYLKLRLL